MHAALAVRARRHVGDQEPDERPVLVQALALNNALEHVTAALIDRLRVDELLTQLVDHLRCVREHVADVAQDREVAELALARRRVSNIH